MALIASALQVVGLALVAVGAFLVAPWLGFAVAGGACVLVGYTLER